MNFLKLIYFFCLIFTILCPPKELIADSIYAFEEAENSDLNKGLEPQDFAFHPMKDITYNESWQFWANYSNGYSSFIFLSVTNFIFSKLVPQINVSIWTPNGEVFTTNMVFSQDDLHASLESYSIKIKDNYFGGSYPTYNIMLNNEEIIINLTYINETPGWRDGSGRVFLDSERTRFWDWSVNSPRAKVSGTIRMNKEQIDVNGYGYHDHTYSNILPSSYSTEWSSFRIFSAEYTFNFLEILTDDKYSNVPIVSLMIAHKNRIIKNINKISITKSDIKLDSKSGYHYPRIIRIEAKDEDFILKGELQVDNLKERIELFSNLNFLYKLVLRTFISNPVGYKFSNHYKFQLQSNDEYKVLEGNSVNELVILSQ